MEVYVGVAIITVVVVLAFVMTERKRKMPIGLEVLDTKENVVYRTDMSMTRFVDRRRLWGSGTLTIDDLGCSGTNLFFIMIVSPYYKQNFSNPPTITVTMTNTSLTWVNAPIDSSEGVGADVLVGVY